MYNLTYKINCNINCNINYNNNIIYNLIKENQSLKNKINSFNINIIEHVRAVPVVQFYNIDNNILLYIESLKLDNFNLFQENLRLKNNNNNI
jgi:hypothetical protein